MKSRNFLHPHSTATEGSIAKGFLLARSPQGDVATGSAVRRFELQHNVSPRFARRRQERRKGQALLLAVLIMLLAALLSAGFLAVVSGNLNQSARIADKTRAIEASRAGIAYANAQLSGSSQGDLWRPIDVSPAPVPGSTNPSYDFYYSQLDKVQGWANTLVPPKRTDTFPNATYNVATYEEAEAIYRNSTYGKFPDPNQAGGDAPKFLVKVQELPLNLPLANTEYKHRGEIKITSIGLSEDDPNVFHRAVAYKVGRRKSPWANALRSISNWNFDYKNRQGGVPFARVPEAVTATNTATPTAPVVSVDVQVETRIDNEDVPQFSKENVPFNVVIIKKGATSANSSVRGAVVIDVTPPATGSTIATLKLARVEAPIGAGETIQKAAAIGTGSTIDLLNTGTPATFATLYPTDKLAQPNGILANGSIWLQNQAQLSKLGNDGTRLFTSGSLAIDDSDPTTAKKLVLPSDIVGNPAIGDPDSNKLVPSNVNYPGNNIVLSAAAISNEVKKTDFIDDGWNKIGSVKALGLEYIPDQTRTVEPFTPVQIDSAQNLARYRALTRNSADGVYINNRDDVEKVGATPMSQADLLKMLTSDAATATDFYLRNAPASPVAADSLEQKHLRGWVGPDEFLARGALVELFPSTTANPGPDAPNPFIRVSLDARSDTIPNGPDPNKTLRDANGNLLPGVYSREIKWPSNGTLFAEGNIRIRGNVNLPVPPATGPDLFPSLTVVSMNNIYIEGSLSVDNRMNGLVPAPDRKKLMLLAKENVIVNPTRAVLARTDVQTIADNGATPVVFTGTPAAPNTQTFKVANALLFNQGDYVTIGTGTNNSVRGLITNVNAPNNQISVRTSDTFTIPAVTPGTDYNVRSSLEARTQEDPAGQNAIFSLVDTEKAVNRRVVAPILRGSRNRIIFDHLGELKGTNTAPTVKEGLKIKAEDFTPTTVPRPSGFTALLTSKQPLNTTVNPLDENLDHDETGITSANKILRTYNSFSTNNKKPFNEFPTTKTLRQLADEIALTAESTGGPNPEGYRYTTDLTPALANIRSNALAGVGLRYDPEAVFVAPFNSPSNNRRQDFNTTEGFTIPLATSVEYDLNGVLSNLQPKSGVRVRKYIGFDPNTETTDNDDVLTVDSSFYHFKEEIIRKSTIDSRILDLAPSIDPTVASFPQSIVLKRSNAVSDATTSNLLPKYWMKSMKLENIDLSQNDIKPVADAMQINAFVYAQEGSWLVIPSDYFRSTPQVRGIKDANNKLVGSYLDYDDSKTPNNPNEYILADPNNSASARIADLNRNGREDGGEREAALRFVRYNMAPIKFLGAIIENQTAVVADVKDAAQTTTLVKGAVQDWMDKWATYDGTGANTNDVGKPQNFSFINYAYDPSLAVGSPGANQLRVPVTDDLLYQQ